jgi:hypothetical protein
MKNKQSKFLKIKGETFFLEGLLGEVFVPDCCMKCQHIEFETGEYCVHPASILCALNLRMPVKKGSCKRQKKL